MRINPLYKGGLLLILMGLIIKVTVLILEIENYLFAGMAFTVIGIGMIGYSIYKNKSIIQNWIGSPIVKFTVGRSNHD